MPRTGGAHSGGRSHISPRSAFEYSLLPRERGDRAKHRARNLPSPFRYILISGTNLDPARLSQLGWAAMLPHELNEIRPNDKPVFFPRPLPVQQASFLQVDQPNVILVTWKQAKIGKAAFYGLLKPAAKPRP